MTGRRVDVYVADLISVHWPEGWCTAIEGVRGATERVAASLLASPGEERIASTSAALTEALWWVASLEGCLARNAGRERWRAVQETDAEARRIGGLVFARGRLGNDLMVVGRLDTWAVAGMGAARTEVVEDGRGRAIQVRRAPVGALLAWTSEPPGAPLTTTGPLERDRRRWFRELLAGRPVVDSLRRATAYLEAIQA